MSRIHTTEDSKKTVWKILKRSFILTFLARSNHTQHQSTSLSRVSWKSSSRHLSAFTDFDAYHHHVQSIRSSTWGWYSISFIKFIWFFCLLCRISNVGGVDGSVYFVIRFDVYTDPSPPPTFKCLPLEELCLTSETVEVNKNDVVDVIFVLSVDAVYKDPISFLGMSNLYYIRFQLTDRDIQSPINWISFRPFGLLLNEVKGLLVFPTLFPMRHQDHV